MAVLGAYKRAFERPCIYSVSFLSRKAIFLLSVASSLYLRVWVDFCYFVLVFFRVLC